MAGVDATGTSARRAVPDLGVGDQRTAGGSADVGKREAALDIDVIVEYGARLRQVTQQVRDDVTRRVESLTGCRWSR